MLASLLLDFVRTRSLSILILTHLFASQLLIVTVMHLCLTLFLGERLNLRSCCMKSLGTSVLFTKTWILTIL